MKSKESSVRDPPPPMSQGSTFHSLLEDKSERNPGTGGGVGLLRPMMGALVH